MIDANVSVLPEGTARRRSRRANEQTAQAERPPQICVTDRDTLPRLPAIRSTHSSTSPSDPPNRPHSPAFERQSAVSPRFRAVDRTNRPPFVRLTILYSPLATLRERALAESRRSDHHCRNAVPNGRTRPRPVIPHGARGGWLAVRIALIYYRLRIPESSSRRRFALRRARHPPQRRPSHHEKTTPRARVAAVRASPAARGLRIARRTVVRPVRRVFPLCSSVRSSASSARSSRTAYSSRPAGPPRCPTSWPSAPRSPWSR